jgi:hypothetical protein
MQITVGRPSYRLRLLAGLALLVVGPIAVNFAVTADPWRTTAYFVTVMFAILLVLSKR